MPSISKSQQRLMAMSYAYKKNELDTKGMPKELITKIKNLADSMSLKDLKDFAETKHKGLPEEVKENKYVLSFENFLNESNKI